MTPNLFRRIAEWWNRPPAPACFDCGASIIAADDDAMICVQCGGRNRRVGHRVGHYPPPFDPQPLTADEVRKIVREEIERAMRPAWKGGRMGPG